MSSPKSKGPLRIGDVFLGRYHVLEMLGRGGFGSVYRARNDFMGREIALKIIDNNGGTSKEAIQRGRQEAVILGQLTHANIVQVFDADVTPQGHLYIAMELLKGRTLADRLSKEGPFPVMEGLTILESLCDALQFAHDRGIAHRDIKPANIFLCADGTVKLLDFGIAKMTSSSEFKTAPDIIVGTNLYVAPEQLHAVYGSNVQKPAPELGDIYALGLVAFQIFQGTHPLVLKAPRTNFRNHFEVWRLHVQTDPPLLHEALPGFPRAVSILVNTALEKIPGERMGKMSDFAAKAKTARLRIVAGQNPAEYTPLRTRPAPSDGSSQLDEGPALSTAPLARRNTKKLFNETDEATRHVELPASAQTFPRARGAASTTPKNSSASSQERLARAPWEPHPEGDTPGSVSRTLTIRARFDRFSTANRGVTIALAMACGLLLSLTLVPLFSHMRKNDGRRSVAGEVVNESSTPAPVTPQNRGAQEEPAPPAEPRQAAQASPQQEKAAPAKTPASTKKPKAATAPSTETWPANKPLFEIKDGKPSPSPKPHATPSPKQSPPAPQGDWRDDTSVWLE